MDVMNIYPDEIVAALECFEEQLDEVDVESELEVLFDGSAGYGPEDDYNDEICDLVCEGFGGEWVPEEDGEDMTCNVETEDWCFGEWMLDPYQGDEYCDDCIAWGGEWAEADDYGMEWWCVDCSPFGGVWLYSEDNEGFECDYKILSRSEIDVNGDLVLYKADFL